MIEGEDESEPALVSRARGKLIYSSDKNATYYKNEIFSPVIIKKIN